MTRPATDSVRATDSVELTIGGMTCASCAARIEKKLNRMDGVSASVNYATEKATVTLSGPVTPDELITTVEACRDGNRWRTTRTQRRSTPTGAGSSSLPSSASR
jgi:copper chaperone CopZ